MIKKFFKFVVFAVAAFVLFGVIMMFFGSNDNREPRKKDSGIQNFSKAGIIYSCDNVKYVSGNPCFPKTDPKYMTIGLFSEPGKGNKIRIKDAGKGVAVVAKNVQTQFGERWVLIETSDGKTAGWINMAFFKVSKKDAGK